MHHSTLADEMIAPEVFRDRFAAQDPLSSLLVNLRLRSMVLGEVEFTAPWGLHLPEISGGFFYVMSGSMVLSPTLAPEWRTIGEGEIGIVFSGREHAAADSAGTPLRRIESVLPASSLMGLDDVRYGGGGESCRVVTGGFFFEGMVRPPLGLPAILHLTRDVVARSMLPRMVGLLAEQSRVREGGSRAVASHMAESIVVESLRMWIASRTSECHAAASAMLDPNLGPVLGLMHERPEKNWSLQELADEAGLSRTLFCQKFVQVVGTTPLEYLREERMRVAAQMLTNGKPEIRTLAQRTGYSSEGAFCTAFKRWSGCTPGEYRLTRVLPM
ncbi:MAG TPA: AraC family transcriptional regulator [Phycisphaerales bacterium]|nr:AraC family transcriptional regulator [Phycisphaerales bacterium]